MYTALYTYTLSSTAYDEEVVATTDSADERYRFISGKVTYEIDRAGSFEFSVPVTNPEIGIFVPLAVKIRLIKDGSTIWMGRVLTISQSLDGIVSIYCEGCLSYLSDMPMQFFKLPKMFNELSMIYVERDVATMANIITPNRGSSPPPAYAPPEIVVDPDYPFPGKLDSETGGYVYGQSANPYNIAEAIIYNNNYKRENNHLKFNRAIFREAYTGRWNLKVVSFSIPKNKETIYDYMSTQMINTWGWHVFVWYDDSTEIKPVLYFFNGNYDATKGYKKSNQAIKLNINLTDLTYNIDGSDYISHILPVGKDSLTLSTDPNSYEFIADVNLIPTTNGMVEGYEKKIKVVEFPNIDNRDQLRTAAVQWVAEYDREYSNAVGAPFTINYDINAVDINWQSTDIKDLIIAGFEYDVLIPDMFDAITQRLREEYPYIKAVCYKSEVDILDPLNSSYTFNFRYLSFLRPAPTKAEAWDDVPEERFPDE